jgi:hypothetical protein
METSTMFPLSHQVYFMRGRVLEHKQFYGEARVCYENAIAINPGHTKSLHHLVSYFLLEGRKKSDYVEIISDHSVYSG